jgi:hypothetical protein
MKNLRSSWVTFSVSTLNINKQIVAIANGRSDIGTDAFNDIANGIAKLGDGS